jgi:hypothetical protein
MTEFYEKLAKQALDSEDSTAALVYAMLAIKDELETLNESVRLYWGDRA